MEPFPQPSSMGTGPTGEYLEEPFTIHPQFLNSCAVDGIDSSATESLHFSIHLNDTCRVAEYHEFHNGGDFGFQAPKDSFLLGCQDVPRQGVETFHDFSQVPENTYNQPRGNDGTRHIG